MKTLHFAENHAFFVASNLKQIFPATYSEQVLFHKCAQQKRAATVLNVKVVAVFYGVIEESVQAMAAHWQVVRSGTLDTSLAFAIRHSVFRRSRWAILR